MKFVATLQLCEEHLKELEAEVGPFGKGNFQMTHNRCDYVYQEIFDPSATKYAHLPLERKICEQKPIACKSLTVEPADVRRLAAAKGGSASTDAKREAARANGAKGGRPKRHSTVNE